jgi:hypothetical protein
MAIKNLIKEEDLSDDEERNDYNEIVGNLEK